MQSTILLLSSLLFSLSHAHIYLTYPGWRGNNLYQGTHDPESSDGLIQAPDGSFPFGMQWEYPCGGMPMSTNRTLWPLGGGAVSFQPGWFPYHETMLTYVNLGWGNNPDNYSMIMQPMTSINGPTNDEYPGLNVCFPQVPLPSGMPAPQVGDNATIQVIMSAKHGAGLFACVDITFAEPSNVPQVNKSNCVNSTGMVFNNIYTTNQLVAGKASSTTPSIAASGCVALGVLLLVGVL